MYCLIWSIYAYYLHFILYTRFVREFVSDFGNKLKMIYPVPLYGSWLTCVRLIKLYSYIQKLYEHKEMKGMISTISGVEFNLKKNCILSKVGYLSLKYVWLMMVFHSSTETSTHVFIVIVSKHFTVQCHCIFI